MSRWMPRLACHPSHHDECMKVLDLQALCRHGSQIEALANTLSFRPIGVVTAYGATHGGFERCFWFS